MDSDGLGWVDSGGVAAAESHPKPKKMGKKKN